MVPYYSQRVPVGEWNASGFSSAQEASYWSERGCGIACLRMVVDACRAARGLGPGPNQGMMISRGLELGAYSEKGWIHAGLVSLARDLAIRGESIRSADLDGLSSHVVQGRLCIASVTVGFEGGTSTKGGGIVARGGHLVVVFGIETTAAGVEKFLVHHPSSEQSYEWRAHWVGRAPFEASFSGSFMSFHHEPVQVQ